MKTINFPGYKPLIPNEVYAKNGEPDRATLLIPAWYRITDEQALYNTLRMSAIKIQRHLDDPLRAHNVDMFLEAELADRPELLTQLITRDPQTTKVILEELPRRFIFGEFLRIHFGQVPTEVINGGAITSYDFFDEEVFAGERDAEWYELMLANTPLETQQDPWSMLMALPEGALPPKKELETLIKHGVSASNILCVDRPDYDPDVAREVIRKVYTQFGDIVIRETLRDITKEVEQGELAEFIDNALPYDDSDEDQGDDDFTTE